MRNVKHLTSEKRLATYIVVSKLLVQLLSGVVIFVLFKKGDKNFKNFSGFSSMINSAWLTVLVGRYSANELYQTTGAVRPG